MTNREALEEQYSDTYKDRTGFRPSLSEVEGWSDAELEAEIRSIAEEETETWD